jgi:hypothetical protein
MPQVLVPGVAQAKFTGTVEGHPWAVIGHYLNNSGQVAWTNANLQAIANSLHATFSNTGTGGIMTYYTAQVQLTSVIVTDIGQAAPAPPGENTTVTLGNSASGQLPPQVCAQVNYVIPARYRGGHPRSMFPGLTSAFAATTNDSWLGSAVTSFQALIAGMWQTAGTAGNGAMCVPTYNYTYTDVPGRHKYTIQKATVKQVYLVTGFTMRQPYGIQRHRAISAG